VMSFVDIKIVEQVDIQASSEQRHDDYAGNAYTGLEAHPRSGLQTRGWKCCATMPMMWAVRASISFGMSSFGMSRK
jgi:hypothetical protein